MQQAEIDAINAQAQKQKERRALQELIHDQKVNSLFLYLFILP